MGVFGYAKRGRAVNEAQAEIHAAFKEVVNRNDESDPRTKRWLQAITAFGAARSRVYPEDLRLVEQGALPASEVDTADILDFLEADPVFYGSGYMKEELLGALKKRTFQQHETQPFKPSSSTLFGRRTAASSVAIVELPPPLTTSASGRNSKLWKLLRTPTFGGALAGFWMRYTRRTAATQRDRFPPKADITHRE
jgi:hypothetical protein